MNTYNYELVTDRYSANGQVDAEDEKAGESIVRNQVANPRQQQGFTMTDQEPTVPIVKSIKLTLKKSA